MGIWCIAIEFAIQFKRCDPVLTNCKDMQCKTVFKKFNLMLFLTMIIYTYKSIFCQNIIFIIFNDTANQRDEFNFCIFHMLIIVQIKHL